MTFRRFKSLLVAVFSAFLLFIFTPAKAGGHEDGDTTKKESGFNASEVVFGHILDAHEFHFLDIPQKDGTKKPVSIPLPVMFILRKEGLLLLCLPNFIMDMSLTMDICC